MKNESVKPGPGAYEILNYLKQARNNKNVLRFKKSNIVDEHLYEIVGGSSRVL